jgi:preprotein translocase subunit SecG
MGMPGIFELLIVGGIVVAIAVVIAILVSTKKNDRD